MSYREIVKQLLPPIVVKLVNRLRATRNPELATREWEYVADDWPEGDPRENGWLHDSIVNTQRAKWASFERSLQSPRPLGVAHEARDPSSQNYSAHNTIMSFAYVLARAAHNRDRLSILDWGGGLGHYAAIARAALPEIALDYMIHDLPSLCAAGREMCRGVKFCSDEKTTFARQYDLVFASASLQYTQHWRTQFSLLAQAAESWLYVTRLPTVSSARSFVVVQRPSLHGYETEYIGWVLNRGDVCTHAQSWNLTLEREFLVNERPSIAGAPEDCEYRGFLFRAGRGAARNER